MNLPNKEDEDDILAPLFVIIKDSTGKIVGGAIDSTLYFRIDGVENGTYTLSLDTGKNYRNFGIEQYDTILRVNQQSINNLLLNLKTVCTIFTDEIAKSDIAKGNVSLIMEPGLVHFVYSRKEKRIQRKYHLKYNWSGCLRYTHHSCLRAYNMVVFDYLDRTYGTKWRKKIINKAVGLN